MLRSGPRRRPRAPRHAALFALPALATVAACGHDPVSPATTGQTGNATTATLANPCRAGTTSPVRFTTPRTAASAYVDTALAFEQEVFCFQDNVPWKQQQDSVHAVSASARTAADAWAAVEYSIDPWLRRAGDEHSAFFRPEDSPGNVDAPTGDARFAVSGVPLAGAGPLAYLWLPTFTGISDVGRADSTQAVIRTLDQAGPCGWVLDLRFNPGGTWASMLAGINPLIGDAPASRTQAGFGGLVDRSNARAYFYVQGGAAGVFDPADNQAYEQVRATSNYTLKRPNSPVALLTGPLTASAGEMITLGFRGGPTPFRTFGAPTYGVTTTPVGRYFADSGYLNVTAGVMFDRTGKLYGGKIQPDQAVAGPTYQQLNTALFGPGYTRTTPTPDASTDAVLQAATTWLRQQRACGGTGSASAGPSFSRAAVEATLPGEVKPSATPARVSRYFVPRGARALAGR